MSAAPGLAPIFDGEALIAKVKQILAEGRGFTLAEQGQVRDGLWKLADANRPLHDFLFSLAREVETRALDRGVERVAIAASAEIAKVAAHRAARPDRWRALSAVQRAAFLAAEEGGGAASPAGRALLRFAELAADEKTADRTPPQSFEPPKW